MINIRLSSRLVNNFFRRVVWLFDYLYYLNVVFWIFPNLSCHLIHFRHYNQCFCLNLKLKILAKSLAHLKIIKLCLSCISNPHHIYLIKLLFYKKERVKNKNFSRAPLIWNLIINFILWCWGQQVFWPLWYQLATCFALSQASLHRLSDFLSLVHYIIIDTNEK